MRTGHCSTAYHLYRIGIVEHPYCDCGDLGTLNHIRFECPINHIQDFDIYKELMKSKLTTPFDVSYILSNLNKQSINILVTLSNIFKIYLWIRV